MVDLISRTNAKEKGFLGALGPSTAARVLDDAMPVLATPAAVAAAAVGVTAAVGAGVAGYAVEEAADG